MTGFVRVGLVAALLAAAAWFYPPIWLGALAAVGRSPGCPFAQAVQAKAHWNRMEQANARLARSLKPLATDGALEHWQTDRGSWWIPKDTRFSLTFNIAEEEGRIYGDSEQFVKPGDIVFDCGANVGVFSREALNAGAAVVVAVEPAPANLECLRRNLADAIAAGKVKIVAKGVWDKEEMLSMKIHEENQAADTFVLAPKGSKETEEKFPLTRIDTLVRELGLPKVDFIKMDIEGAEPRALEGARDTIARFHPRLSISVYHEADHPKLVPEKIRAAWSGYQFRCGPCQFRQGHILPDIYWFR